MNILQFLYHNVKSNIILIMLLLCLWGAGCPFWTIMDPLIQKELYEGKTKINDEIVYVSTTKYGEEYDYGPSYVWFMLPDKSIWKLYCSPYDPKTWRLTHRDPNGFQEDIPLVQYNFSARDQIKWPTEWNLVPSKKR